jgi:hypothetical protein
MFVWEDDTASWYLAMPDLAGYVDGPSYTFLIVFDTPIRAKGDVRKAIRNFDQNDFKPACLREQVLERTCLDDPTEDIGVTFEDQGPGIRPIFPTSG